MFWGAEQKKTKGGGEHCIKMSTAQLVPFRRKF